MKTYDVDINSFLYNEPVTPKHKLPKNGPCKMCGQYSTNCYICDAAVCSNNHVVSSSKTLGDCDNHLIISVSKKGLCSAFYEARAPPAFVPSEQKLDNNSGCMPSD
jgi:hypothetical protein